MEEMEEIQSERGKEIRKGTTIFSCARPACWSAGRETVGGESGMN